MPEDTLAARLRRALFGRNHAGDIPARIAELSDMIGQEPDAPANHVFRGELYLQAGQLEAAADDFQRALDMASEQTQAAQWGFISQALQDRAFAGLEKTRRILARAGPHQLTD